MTRRELLESGLGLTGARLPEGTLDFQCLLPVQVPRSGIFALPEHMVWCASMVRTPDGLCHMLFSRWPRHLGFDACATHSAIAYATAATPTGPYVFRHVALAARGAEFRDGHATHNPCVIEHGGKFYLYYAGNHGPAAWKPDASPSQEGWWDHRNNQRVGVAVSDHPLGPIRRQTEPKVDKSRVFKRRFDFHIDDHDAPNLTQPGRCLYLIESPDGLKWGLSKHPLEMPKLHFETDKPRVLFLAARPAGDPAAASFNVAISSGGLQ